MNKRSIVNPGVGVSPHSFRRMHDNLCNCRYRLTIGKINLIRKDVEKAMEKPSGMFIRFRKAF